MKEATHIPYWTIRYHHHFNPRLREGGDHSLLHLYLNEFYFNPRLREGGDKRFCNVPLCWSYFNPRLREGGDIDCDVQIYSLYDISIHASVKEATFQSKPLHESVSISIHASVKEATILI